MPIKLLRLFLILGMIFSLFLLSSTKSYAGITGACCGCNDCNGGFSGICGEVDQTLCEILTGGDYQGDGTTCSPIDPCYKPTDCDDTFCQISEEACMNCAEANEGATCQWCGEVELCFTPFDNCPTPTPTTEPSPTPTPESEGTVILPTLGQWGMIFTTLLLGLYAVLKLRRRTES